MVLPAHIRSRVSRIVPVIPLSEDKFEEEEEIKIPEELHVADEELNKVRCGPSPLSKTP